ncbi:unnamed protein product [Trichobilharzia szidati]|nr:unnamed protein product [Trichobilharzia szidati]
MDIKEAIEKFNIKSLKPTLVETRCLDGSVIINDKYGLETKSDDKVDRPEPNFSCYGYIPNFEPDLQIGKINLSSLTILFGSADVAQNLELLKDNNVTHIINLVSNVVPNYFPKSFEYLALVAYDTYTFDLHDTLNQCCDFLNSVKEKGGCCYIHCQAGLSRAPSIVIGYLIQACNYSYKEAYTTVNNTRNVCINMNFKSQLERLKGN